MPWKERLLIAVSIIAALPLFLGVMMIIGMMMDGIGRYDEEHDRCLRHAVNGYDIHQCR